MKVLVLIGRVEIVDKRGFLAAFSAALGENCERLRATDSTSSLMVLLVVMVMAAAVSLLCRQEKELLSPGGISLT